jgi:DNA-directed RNA polymerase subunit M/transcription elongation factor TFIIS
MIVILCRRCGVLLIPRGRPLRRRYTCPTCQQPMEIKRRISEARLLEILRSFSEDERKNGLQE